MHIKSVENYCFSWSSEAKGWLEAMKHKAQSASTTNPRRAPEDQQWSKGNK